MRVAPPSSFPGTPGSATFAYDALGRVIAATNARNYAATFSRVVPSLHTLLMLTLALSVSALCLASLGCAARTTGSPLAQSPWPKFRCDLRNTGRSTHPGAQSGYRTLDQGELAAL